MATWHQMQAGPVRLYHETEWTVVVDPPNRPMGTISFAREADARAYAAKVPYSYVLRPAVPNGR